MIDFGQVLTAMITPFKGNDSARKEIDYDALEKLIKHLIATGTDSIVVAGTTGESPTLTHEEEAELFKFTKKTANAIDPNVKIIFGTGSNCTRTVIESNKEAEEYGADGLLIVTPYYNKPNQRGLAAHFNHIAKETSLPIIVYNIPGRSVINIDTETLFEIIDKNENIIGIKEATDDLDKVAALRNKYSHERFKIYSGDDIMTLPMMAKGADGVVSVASHLVGNEMKDMLAAFEAGKNDEAQKIHNRLEPLFNALFVEPNPTCVKACLDFAGICSSTLREPLVELEESQIQDLRKVYDSICVGAQV